MNKTKTFISYRRENGGIAYAHILHERLSALGIDCFFDISAMHDFSKEFEMEIETNIKSCDYVIILLQNGCLAERNGTDYFLKEIRLAKTQSKELLLLPIGDDFVWERQKDIPGDIEELKKLNLCVPLKIQTIMDSIQSLLSRMKLNDGHLHHLLLLKMQMGAMSDFGAPLLQKTSNIYHIDIEERWARATRISLMALGCSSVVRRFSPLIKEKAETGTRFRFLAIDPTGDSATDVLRNKTNASSGSQDDFLSHNYDQMLRTIASIDTGNGNITYRRRLTISPLRCTGWSVKMIVKATYTLNTSPFTHRILFRIYIVRRS